MISSFSKTIYGGKELLMSLSMSLRGIKNASKVVELPFGLSITSKVKEKHYALWACQEQQIFAKAWPNLSERAVSSMK